MIIMMIYVVKLVGGGAASLQVLIYDVELIVLWWHVGYMLEQADRNATAEVVAII